jgi:hypothetical protein
MWGGYDQRLHRKSLGNPSLRLIPRLECIIHLRDSKLNRGQVRADGRKRDHHLSMAINPPFSIPDRACMLTAPEPSSRDLVNQGMGNEQFLAAFVVCECTRDPGNRLALRVRPNRRSDAEPRGKEVRLDLATLTPRSGKDVGFSGLEVAIDDTVRADFHNTRAVSSACTITDRRAGTRTSSFCR